jgi:hypothetical protein
MTIYNIMLLFPSKNQISIPSLAPSIITNIQQVVYRALHTGLVLQEETDHVLPSYKAWLVYFSTKLLFPFYTGSRAGNCSGSYFVQVNKCQFALMP